jgi:hypothetical protein
LGIARFVEGRGRALFGKLGDGRGGAGVVFQFGNEIWYALDWGVTITFHFDAYYSKYEKYSKSTSRRSHFLKTSLLCRSSYFGLHS